MNNQKVQMRVKGNKILKQIVLQGRDFSDHDKLLFYTQIIRDISKLKARQVERMSKDDSLQYNLDF